MTTPRVTVRAPDHRLYRGVSNASSGLTWPDYAVVATSLLILLAFGGPLSRKQRDTTDFFLARRRVPWWAACLSFLATEISAVTILSVPATAYSENWEYAQFFIGSSLAKLVVAFLFIPAFYRHNVTTIYEFLHARFGRRTQTTASVFFFVTRLAGSGARLTMTALAVGYLLHWSLVSTIAIFTVVSVIYIAKGGVEAVVWTNVFQAIVFLGAGAATLLFLLAHVSGGLGAVMSTAHAAGRLTMVDWGPRLGSSEFFSRALTNPNIVWVALLNGLFGATASFGTDHDLMQRLLTVETRRESQRTLAFTVVGTLVTLLIYMTLGAGLFAYYAQHGAPVLNRPDEILPHFIRSEMPVVLRGFMLAAIVLSSIDSPLGSLSASFVTDIYRPLIARGKSEKHYLSVSRGAVVVFGVLLALIAWGFAFVPGPMLWNVFKVAGVTSGSLLGVFLLGLLTRRPIVDNANVFAMVAMSAVNLALLLLSETGRVSFAWSWLVVLGTLGTMVIATLTSAFSRGKQPLDDRIELASAIAKRSETEDPARQ
jgi:solute:Na+ symporter, SSS family